MSPSSEVRIGERIRFYRQAKGKTQAVVAGLAGVTEDYLSQIERGLKTPTIALLHRFAKILGVRISDLLGESAAVQDEASTPAGKAVQHALMAYGGDDSSAGPADMLSCGVGWTRPGRYGRNDRCGSARSRRSCPS